MKKLLATVLCVVLLAGMCVIPGFAYGSEAETLGELLAEYDYTADGLDYEISTWFYQNTNSSFYDLRSDNAEAQLEGTYYAVSDISGVIEILLEDSESEFEDVYHRNDNGDVTVVEQSEDYYSWGSERILIRTTDGSLPRLIIFLDSSGDSCLFCWETGKGCKLSDGAYDKIKEVLGIDNLSEEDALTYSYYPLPDGLDEYIEEETDSKAASSLELPDISEYAPEDGVTFYALVIDTTIGKTGNYGLQLCALNINDINHRGLCTATVKVDTELLNADGEITAEDISMGDIIALTYSGEVEDTYPSNVLGVTRVYVVDHVDTLGEIESLIPDWCDDNGDFFPAWNDFVAKLAELDYSVGDGKVTLSWGKTSDETYAVYWKRSSSDEWKLACETSKHKVNIIGLRNGMSYDFKVVILGQDSEVVTATPTDDIDYQSLPTVDCFGNDIAYDNRGVVAVSASDITNTQLTVTLTNNGDEDVSFDGTYLIQEYKDGEWSFVKTDFTSLDSTLELFTATANGGSDSAMDRWTALYGELPAGHYRLLQYYYYETDDGRANVYGVCGFDVE